MGVEEMLCCKVKRAALYYNETHSREYIDVDAGLRQAVKDMFGEMHELYRRGYTPKVKPAAKCGRCSLNGICLPFLMRRQKSVSGYIAEHMGVLKEKAT